MDNEIKYRVDSLQAFFLISIALLVDLIQALLNLFAIGIFINRIISAFVWLFFFTWFYFVGIKFTKGNGKNLNISLVGLVIEMIPLLDLLPGWTVSNILLISASRREDKGKKPAKKKKGGKEKEKKDKKPKGKKTEGETGAEKKPAVGGEVKASESTPKSAQAKKELETSQTGGTKTAEQKTTEDNLNPEKKEPKKENQPVSTENKEGAEKEKKEEGGKGKEEDKVYDTRTNRYKNQQGQSASEELAEFEDLPMQKQEKSTPILNEGEGGQDKQEFSMGDPYREPTK